MTDKNLAVETVAIERGKEKRTMTEEKICCDGCKKEIKGTEEKPANVWNTYDDKENFVRLCDRCNKLYCNDCGASLYREGAKYNQADDDSYYCDNGLCQPFDEE